MIREAGPNDESPSPRSSATPSIWARKRDLWSAHLPIGPGCRAFVGFADGRLIGAGGFFVDGDVGDTDFRATAPAFRGRGAQPANLAHRVRAGLEAGARRNHLHRRGRSEL